MTPADVKQRLDRNSLITQMLAEAVGPCSDRQLATSIGAHPITMRRAINSGSSEAVGGAKVVHKSRDQVLQQLDAALPDLDTDQAFEALERRVLAVLAQIKHRQI